jgi:hypothetical protein
MNVDTHTDAPPVDRAALLRSLVAAGANQMPPVERSGQSGEMVDA